ncbi:MAG: ABC-2 transporter permease [Anaerolineaceae bacterium]|nr:ABC-2 transporter permease [Anaerolineaceae bacterium]
MLNLLRKEFKLSVHPTCFIFLSFGSMLLIPNYPYYVAFFYQTLAIFFMFMAGNATNDIFFTTLLPIRKVDAVKARVVTVVIIELMQILLSIPFAFLRYILLPTDNMAGMEANAAFFGFVLIMFGIFNLIFLPKFYKTAYKTGWPFLNASIAMLLFIAVVEAAVNLNPAWKLSLDTINPAYLPQQLIVLVLGLIVFAALTLIGNNLSVKRFETLDL